VDEKPVSETPSLKVDPELIRVGATPETLGPHITGAAPAYTGEGVTELQVPSAAPAYQAAREGEVAELIARLNTWADSTFNEAWRRDCREAARRLQSLSAHVENLLRLEQERLLMASEEQIRREILNDGRDPEEYLRAIDSSMKCAVDNALLTYDLAKAEERVKVLEAENSSHTNALLKQAEGIRESVSDITRGSGKEER